MALGGSRGRSYVIAAPPAERDRLLAGLDELLDALDELRDGGTIEHPYVVRAYRADRRFA